MNFQRSEEVVELERVARDVVERECPAALVRGVVEAGKDITDWWNTLVELEWPGIALPVEVGGSGASAVELGVILEQLGWAADPSPFFATTCLFAPLVAGDAALARAICNGTTGSAITSGITAERNGDGWVLSGTARHVIDGDRADHLAVVVNDSVYVVARDAFDAAREPSIDASLRLGTVTLTRSTARRLEGADVAGAHDQAVAGMAAMTVGASQHVLDLVLDHIRNRHQFGVPIGSFQAVKHMAVDIYVAIERARALVQYAARAIAESDPHAHLAATMAKAAAGDAQRIAAQHGVQLYGALGFTWENDLQIFVKRAKTLDMILGSAREHRLTVASAVLAGADTSLKLQLDDKAAAFERDFETWLDTHTPDASTTEERARSSSHIPEWAKPFQRAMFDDGWLLPGNATEFGGRNASLLEQFVHQEVLSRRRIYHSFNPQGLSIIVPSLLAFGTEEQKQRWAVPIMRAEITAALGMSEPDAGSDLAGLRTRAVRDGDHFVVNGQKVWTSGAHDADVILAFVRTDPDVPKHKGISVLVIPTDTPGVTCRPFGSISGADELDFNEVFFDDALVPVENLIGDLNDGWRVATGSLGHERAMLWLGYADRLDDLVTRGGDVIRARELSDDAFVLDWYAQLAIDTQALRLLGYRTLAEAQRGVETREQSILKLFGSEAAQRATLQVMEALGEDALDPSLRSGPHEPHNLDVWTLNWFDLYLRSFSMTIAGGTSQIQRNIIGERVLGLPRS